MDRRSTAEYGVSRATALASSLAEAGLRIFTTQDAVKLRPGDFSPTTVRYLLKVLTDAGWIIRLSRDLYAGTGRLPGVWMYRRWQLPPRLSARPLLLSSRPSRTTG